MNVQVYVHIGQDGGVHEIECSCRFHKYLVVYSFQDKCAAL